MADWSDLGLVGTKGAFTVTAFPGGSRDSDAEAVATAAKIVPVFFLLVGVIGNVVTIVALYRCKVGRFCFVVVVVVVGGGGGGGGGVLVVVVFENEYVP